MPAAAQQLPLDRQPPPARAPAPAVTGSCRQAPGRRRSLPTPAPARRSRCRRQTPGRAGRPGGSPATSARRAAPPPPPSRGRGVPSGPTRLGTNSPLGFWPARASRVIRIMRRVCSVGATSRADGVIGTRTRSAIIRAEARVGTSTGGRSSTTRRSPPASSPARAGQRPRSCPVTRSTLSTATGRRPPLAHAPALPWGSRSSRVTSWPRVASAQARLTATVVLPTPPLRLPHAMIWPMVRT